MSCSPGPVPTRRRSRSSMKCRCGWRRCCSPASSTATPGSRWRCSSPTPSGSPTPSTRATDLRPVRQRASRPRQAASFRGVLRAVRDQLRVRRDRRVPPVAAVREHRDLGLGRLSPRRCRLLVGDPQHDRQPACPTQPRPSCSARTPGGSTGSSRSCSSPKSRRPIDRPDWFPQGPELDEWAELVAHPRQNAGGTGPPGRGRGERHRPRAACGPRGPVTDGSVVDVDSHVYEPPAIWDEYVPAELRGTARSAFYHEVDDDGNPLTILNGAVGSRTQPVPPGASGHLAAGDDPEQHRPARP